MDSLSGHLGQLSEVDSRGSVDFLSYEHYEKVLIRPVYTLVKITSKTIRVVVDLIPCKTGPRSLDLLLTIVFSTVLSSVDVEIKSLEIIK